MTSAMSLSSNVQLESEKEAVRYFWRNKMIEGRTQGAIMLNKYLQATPQ